jgi:hypothetical protein
VECQELGTFSATCWCRNRPTSVIDGRLLGSLSQQCSIKVQRSSVRQGAILDEGRLGRVPPATFIATVTSFDISEYGGLPLNISKHSIANDQTSAAVIDEIEFAGLMTSGASHRTFPDVPWETVEQTRFGNTSALTSSKNSDRPKLHMRASSAGEAITLA